jgi:hypothetical protein
MWVDPETVLIVSYDNEEESMLSIIVALEKRS